MVRLALHLFAAALLLPGVGIAAPDPVHRAAVWVATGDGLSKLDAADGRELARFAHALGFDAVAVDPVRGRVWSVKGTKLHAFDFAARPLLVTDTEERGGGAAGHVVALEVDPSSGDVHLLESWRLLRVDGTGILRDVIVLEAGGGEARALALAQDGERAMAWIGAEHQVTAYDVEAQTRTARLPLSGVAALAWDAAAGVLYLADPGHVHRYRPEEGFAAAIPFEQAASLAPDGAGGTWIASAVRLVHVDATGMQSRQRHLPPDIQGTLRGAVADAVGGIWLAGTRRLRHVAASGELALFTEPAGRPPLHALAFYTDRQAPILTVVAPPTGIWTREPQPAIQLEWHDAGVGVDPQTLVAEVAGGAELVLHCDNAADAGLCRPLMPLTDGFWPLDFTIADFAGNRSAPAALDLNVDTVAPSITLVHPVDGLLTNEPSLVVQGSVGEPATLWLDGTQLALLPTEPPTFAHEWRLDEGPNTFTLTAEDRAGNRSEVSAAVVLDTVAPAQPEDAHITVELLDGMLWVRGSAGAVEPNSSVLVRDGGTGEGVMVQADAEGAFLAILAAGPSLSVTVAARDAAGNTGPLLLRQALGGPPADPALLAPPAPPGVASSLLDLESFLFTGTDPIQRGVDPAVFDARRFAVVRGRVTDENGAPLAAVTVGVLGHPGYGHTRTRSDGEFDLVVNGGGMLTIDYVRAGRLPAQRAVEVPWGDYAYAPEVALIELDEVVTVVDLDGADMQVARGSLVSDADGPRQATLLFPAGLVATATNGAGEGQPLARLSVRATEYTLGARGPERMPAELPPASGYTYAVELSIDEALAIGAASVQFDRPVPFYVENFLEFPTGSGVPTGYYDRARGIWVPSENGRVIEVVRIEQGAAVLDVSGRGVASESELAQMGIAHAERVHLAALYLPGTSLWRAPLQHFSAWDLNFPFGPPDGATASPAPQERLQPPDGERIECDGCIIHPDDRSLAKEIAIAGTDLRLRYDSSRQPGYRRLRRIEIPVTGDSVHPELKRVDVTVTVAGRRFERSFEAVPNQTWAFDWDGRDIRGRTLHQRVTANVRVAHVYPMLYLVPPFGSATFGTPPPWITVHPRGRLEFGETAVTREWRHPLGIGADVVGSAALGGWTLDRHHAYAQLPGRAGELEHGDGRTVPIAGSTPIIDTISGSGCCGLSGVGGPAPEALVSLPEDVVVGPDGAFYFSSSAASAVFRVHPDDGILRRIAGRGPSAADGIPALEAAFGAGGPMGLAFGPDGSLYLADTYRDRVRRITPEGIIYTVAGSGGGLAGDGGPAIQARLRRPEGVAVGRDGIVYIADTGNHRIRRVTPDGIITTYAGTGNEWTPGFSGDGGPAAQAMFSRPAGLAIGPGGELYVADRVNNVIRRIDHRGIIERVAGNLSRGASGDGGPALAAELAHPSGIAVAADGTLFVADRDNDRVRTVKPDGTIHTLAGHGRPVVSAATAFGGDGGPAARAGLWRVTGVALAPDGNVLAVDQGNHRVRQIAFAGALLHDGGAAAVADAAGVFVHRMGAGGNHLATYSAATGAALSAFAYDAHHRLVEMQGADGEATTIERGADGRALAIVAPSGQRTQLEVDGGGRLVAITDPTGSTSRFAYDPGGLMTAFVDPMGNAAQYAYDAEGELTRDSDAVGGGWALTRSAPDDVAMVTALGRRYRFVTETLAGGIQRQREITPDGITMERLLDSRQRRATRLRADGTTLTIEEGPDPRFGMQSPVRERVMLQTPGGRQLELRQHREVTPHASDPLRALILRETVEIGAARWTGQFDAGSSMLALTTPEGRQTAMELDAAHRPVSLQQSGRAPWRFERDPAGRLVVAAQGVGPEIREVRLEYGMDGLLRSLTDPMGREIAFARDAAGRPTITRLPDGSVLELQWNARGNLTAIVPPGGGHHVFDYSEVGLDVSYAPPELAGVDTITRYGWNADRQLERVDRPDGEALSLAYDAAGRLESVAAAGRLITFGFDAVTGQLRRVADELGTELEYAHDGALLLSEHWAGAVRGAVHREYDAQLRLSELTIGTHAVALGYDRDGLLIAAADLQLERAASGDVVATTLGAVSTEELRNPFGEPVRIVARHGTRELLALEYERDLLGRVRRVREREGGRDVLRSYEYDERGRLQSVAVDGRPRVHHAYDANGNRLSRGSTVGDYDAQDRLVAWGANRYQHGDGGELLTRTGPAGTTSYDYDAFGSLRGVRLPDGTAIEYLIDPRGRRVGRMRDGHLEWGLLYADQLNPVARLDGDGAIDHIYVYGSRLNVPDYLIEVASGTAFRIVTDPIGSVRLVISEESGEIVQRLEYDELGAVAEDSHPGFQPFGFAGGLYDPITGLVRFGARDYDPEVGRFTAKDPIGFWGNDSGLYAYAYNDPINHFDPTGHVGLLGAGVGAVIGGVSSGIGTLATTGSLAEAAASAVTGAAAGALIGAVPGVGLIRSIALGGGMAGMSNAAAQGIGLAMQPCSSAADFNFGAFLGATLGGGLVAARSFPAGTSIPAQLGLAPGNLGISATSTGIGTGMGNR
jgi:RHS repeat-associated protein